VQTLCKNHKEQNKQQTHPQPGQPKPARPRACLQDARVHYPTVKNPTHQPRNPPTPTRMSTGCPGEGGKEECDSSKPNSVSDPTHPHHHTGSTSKPTTSMVPLSEQHHHQDPNGPSPWLSAP
jgi:hypothetical protein